MDELDPVRRLRSEAPLVALTDLRRARAALLDEIEGTHPRRSWSPVRWLGWRMAVGGGLAAALIAALFAAQGALGPHDRAGGGLSTFTASAGGSDPAQILRKVSLAAQHEQILPARPGQYVFLESITVSHGERFDCDGEADQSHCTAIPAPSVREVSQMWLSVDGNHNGLVRQRPESSRGKWQETPLVQCPKGVHRVGADGKPIKPACVPIPAYRTDLPTNPKAMSSYLQQEAVEPHTNGGVREEAYAFTVAGDLIRKGYLPPATLAALFQAAAQIPGIAVTHDVFDAAGRQGISIGWVGHGVHSEMIFDPETYAYLGDRTVALQEIDGLKKGDIVDQSARLRLAIVDRPGQLP